MITVTNIHFYDIEGYGTKSEFSAYLSLPHYIVAPPYVPLAYKVMKYLVKKKTKK
jgi:hypothetical protein